MSWVWMVRSRASGAGYLALIMTVVGMAALALQAASPPPAEEKGCNSCTRCSVVPDAFASVSWVTEFAAPEDKPKSKPKKPAGDKEEEPPEVTIDVEDEPPAEKPKAEGKSKPAAKKPAAKPAKKPAADEDAEPAADEDAEPKPKTKIKPKTTVKGKGKEEIPAFVGAPESVCAVCLGTGHIPLSVVAGGRRPYTHMEGEKAPSASICVPWRHCPKCAADADPDSLVAEEAERIKSMNESHAMWEAKTGWKMIRVESRHVAFHCDGMPPDMARRQGQTAEALAEFLQRQTKSVYLTQSRPGKYEKMYCWDKPKYIKAINVCQTVDEFRGDQDWELISKCSGFSGPITSVTNIEQGKQVPPENTTISSFAAKNVMIATGGKAKPWLSCGMPYACELAMTNKVLVHYINYQLNEIRLGGDWKAETQTRLQQKKLRHWEALFPVPLQDYHAEEHLSAFAAVAYLFKTDPRKFCLMCLAIKEGKEDVEAIESVYGKKIAELEAGCARWIMGR